MGAENEDWGRGGCPHSLLIWMLAAEYSVCKNPAKRNFTHTLRQTEQTLILYLRVRGTQRSLVYVLSTVLTS